MSANEKPYFVILNPKGLHSVTIDRKIINDFESSLMIENFKKDGFTIKEVTESEYQKIKSEGDFHLF
jgi:hypothetical protein